MASDAFAADHFIDRIDQAGAEVIGPQAIRRGASEIGVLPARDPVGEGGARRRLLVPLGLRAVDKGGLNKLICAGDGNFPLAGDLVGGGDKVTLALSLQTGEEGGQAPELVALPTGERVVMALST